MDEWFGWPITDNWIIAPIYSPVCHCVCLLFSLHSPFLSLSSVSFFLVRPPLLLSSFLSHFFPVTNLISCAPYGFCPLWVRINARKGGREVFCYVSGWAVPTRCFSVFYSSERRTVCLSLADTQPACECVSVCVFERKWLRVFVCLRGTMCVYVCVCWCEINYFHIH